MKIDEDKKSKAPIPDNAKPNVIKTSLTKKMFKTTPPSPSQKCRRDIEIKQKKPHYTR
jgi:hypothetical protein